MQALPIGAATLLQLWENGLGRPPAEQALLTLRASFVEQAPGDLALLTIGQRNALLICLRMQTFGARIEGQTACPKCAEQIETSFEAGDLLALASFPDNRPPDNWPDGGTYSASISEYELVYRLPTCQDIEVAARLPVNEARQSLLAACLLKSVHAGNAIPVSSLPAEVIDGLEAGMEKADPLANISLPVSCPACGHHWELAFEIASFLWSEINTWAMRIMREVHSLASAYGWSEADILAMSAWRRQRYLELVGQ